MGKLRRKLCSFRTKKKTKEKAAKKQAKKLNSWKKNQNGVVYEKKEELKIKGLEKKL